MEKAGLWILDAEVFHFSLTPMELTSGGKSMGHYVQTKLLPNYPELLRKL